MADFHGGVESIWLGRKERHVVATIESDAPNNPITEINHFITVEARDGVLPFVIRRNKSAH